MLCILLTSMSLAQKYERQPEIEEEVNRQLWKPFKDAWEARDWKAFVALHTDDVVRINTWGGIRVGKEYTDGIKASSQNKTDRKRTIDYWLEHRMYSGSMGYEVGYYRVVNRDPGKEPTEHYARFHIVLRKEEGRWKIAQDWDTSVINGIDVTAADFAKGSPVVE